jgi:hypothetical protein
MIVSFSGPSSLSPAEEAFCRAELRRLRARDGSIDTWRSGGAYGLDTLVVEESGADQDVTLVVPDGLRWNTELTLQYDYLAVTYVPGGYRARNEALVAGADELHAFLRYPSFYRSGEWMTVNIAKRARVPVFTHVFPA